MLIEYGRRYLVYIEVSSRLLKKNLLVSSSDLKNVRPDRAILFIVQ